MKDLRQLPPAVRTSALAMVARTAARHADACDERMFPAVMAQLRAALSELRLLEPPEAKDWVDNLATDLATRRARKGAG